MRRGLFPILGLFVLSGLLAGVLSGVAAAQPKPSGAGARRAEFRAARQRLAAVAASVAAQRRMLAEDRAWIPRRAGGVDEPVDRIPTGRGKPTVPMPTVRGARTAPMPNGAPARDRAAYDRATEEKPR